MSTASRWLAVAPDGLLLEEAGALEDTEEPAGLEEDGAFAGSLELAEEGVRVNAIAPGAVRTNIWNVPGLSPEEAKKHQEGIAATIPMGRFAEPAEIANMAAFLVSDEAAYITGAIMAVDGGQGAL